MSDISRIKELTKMLNEYRDAYYNDSKSLVSDKKYDELYDELQELENKTGFFMSNSPTQTVGYEVVSELQKVKHSHPMLSLDKTKNTSDLIKFAGEHECLLSLKMDGLTCLLTYDKGKLVKAETRGNGEIGEDITHNAKVFENIPLTIPVDSKFEIEGEAIITYNDFNKINSKLSDDNKYKNPRNLASGSVRQLDSSIAKNRHIKFIAWKVPRGFTYYSEGLTFAQKIGFEVVPYIKICKFDNEVDYDMYINTLQNIAMDLSYPIDGLVMTYNNKEYGNSLGITSHHPKHSLAYKFYDDIYETVLKDIEWTMGKSGTLTPTAVFEPVEIDGTIVERASVHNVSILTELDLQIGDTITVYKANAIIPQVSDNLSAKERKDTTYIKIPSTCPICGCDTVIKQDNNSKVLICTNDKCFGKSLGRLCHFVSKNAMNIDGLSEATLQFLISEFNVYCFEDLYVIKNYKDSIRKWKQTDGFGDKSVDKILDAIETSRTVTLDRLINAISIPNIGKSTAKDIAKFCNYDIDTFKKYMQDCRVFYNIDGIGDKIIESMNEWYNTEFIDFLSLCRYLNIIKPNSNTSSNVNGLTFCITGSLNIFKNRDEAIQKIEAAGGKVTGSVSKKTDYLVNNDSLSTSGKNKKAKELNIPIITEKELINMLGE